MAALANFFSHATQKTIILVRGLFSFSEQLLY